MADFSQQAGNIWELPSWWKEGDKYELE